MYLSKPKTTSLSKVKKKADKWFSLYIRLRDSIDYCRRIGLAPDEGIGQCCTCPTIKQWRYMDCGHFISKGKGGASNVRWDERNAHLQCKSCNAFKQGNAQAYEEFMKAKYGTRIITLLSIKNRTVHRYMVVELWALAQFYKDKFEELKKQGC